MSENEFLISPGFLGAVDGVRGRGHIVAHSFDAVMQTSTLHGSLCHTSPQNWIRLYSSVLNIINQDYFVTVFARLLCCFCTALITVHAVHLSVIITQHQGNPTFLWSHFTLDFPPFSDPGLPQCVCDASSWEHHARHGPPAGGCGDWDVQLQLQAVGPAPPALRTCAAVGRHAHRCQHDEHGRPQDPSPGCRPPRWTQPGGPASLLRGPESSLEITGDARLDSDWGWAPVITLVHI